MPINTHLLASGAAVSFSSDLEGSQIFMAVSVGRVGPVVTVALNRAEAESFARAVLAELGEMSLSGADAVGPRLVTDIMGENDVMKSASTGQLLFVPDPAPRREAVYAPKRGDMVYTPDGMAGIVTEVRRAEEVGRGEWGVGSQFNSTTPHSLRSTPHSFASHSPPPTSAMASVAKGNGHWAAHRAEELTPILNSEYARGIANFAAILPDCLPSFAPGFISICDGCHQPDVDLVEIQGARVCPRCASEMSVCREVGSEE